MSVGVCMALPFTVRCMRRRMRVPRRRFGVFVFMGRLKTSAAAICGRLNGVERSGIAIFVRSPVRTIALLPLSHGATFLSGWQLMNLVRTAIGDDHVVAHLYSVGRISAFRYGHV